MLNDFLVKLVKKESESADVAVEVERQRKVAEEISKSVPVNDEPKARRVWIQPDDGDGGEPDALADFLTLSGREMSLPWITQNPMTSLGSPPQYLGSPVLTMAARGSLYHEDAKGKSPEPKLPDREMEGVFDIFSSPPTGSTSSPPSGQKTGKVELSFNERFARKPEQYELSPSQRPISNSPIDQSGFTVETGPTSAVQPNTAPFVLPPGIPNTWNQDATTDNRATNRVDNIDEPNREFLKKMREVFGEHMKGRKTNNNDDNGITTTTTTAAAANLSTSPTTTGDELTELAAAKHVTKQLDALTTSVGDVKLVVDDMKLVVDTVLAESRKLVVSAIDDVKMEVAMLRMDMQQWQLSNGVQSVDMLNEVSADESLNGATDWEAVSDDVLSNVDDGEPGGLVDSDDECDCLDVPTHELSARQQEMRKHRESQEKQVVDMAEFAQIKESEQVAERMARSVVKPPGIGSKRQRKRLAQMQTKLAEAHEAAALRGRDIEVWIKELEDKVSEFREDPCESQDAPHKPSIVEEIARAWPNLDGLRSQGYAFDIVESNGLDEMSPFGNVPVSAVNGVIKEGSWLRVRNGITMDSGASVFVIPTDWLQMFQIRESEGSKRGQTYTAAAKDGKPIVNEGEKTIKFFTGPSLDAEKRKLVCQVAKVNKILASIAGFCDAGNDVLFTQTGGVIRNLTTGAETPFRRVGNIYVMDAYIPNPDFDKHPDGKVQPVFTRPAR
jgi:hypothetical protein